MACGRRVHLAADDPRHHRPESKVVLPGDHQYPDIGPAFHEIAEGLGRHVACEPAARDEHLAGELAEGHLLPRSVPGPGFEGWPQDTHRGGRTANHLADSRKLVERPSNLALPGLSTSCARLLEAHRT